MVHVDYSLADGLLYSPHQSALQSIDNVKRNKILIWSGTTCEFLSKPLLGSRHVF